MKRILLEIALGLPAALAVAYGIDWLSVAVRIANHRQVYADIQVDQVYLDTNKYNEVEHSIGKSVMERCVYAVFPHSGYRPCWYVTRHTMRVTNTD